MIQKKVAYFGHLFYYVYMKLKVDFFSCCLVVIYDANNIDAFIHIVERNFVSVVFSD